MKQRSIPQAVFDSPEAIRATKLGHEAACAVLGRTPLNRLGEGNPNHPRYDLHLFGERHETFLKRQHERKAA